MKIRLIAFVATLMMALAAPKQAAADPITAIVTTVAKFAASSAIAGFVVKMGLSLALTALSTVLSKKQKPAQQTQGGIKTESTTNGGTNPQTFIMGRYATAGNMAAPPYSFPNDGDPPNHTLVYVIDIADMPGVTLERVMIAGEYVDLDQTSPNSWRAYNRDGNWRLHMHWQGGHQTAADGYMISNFAGHPNRPWTADMVGRGVTYAVVSFFYTPEIWNQLPGMRFQVMGIPLYDPRKDSSVGGSGAHRWNNPSTWTQTENPIVMIYNILRGITLPDGKIWGGRVQPEDLPLASWFAAMNECDVQVALNGGSTEAQYRAGIEVSVDEAPADVIDELLAACSGEIAEFGGVYKPRVGPPALPVYFFTDSDIIADRPEKLTPYPGLDAVHNAIHATYPEPAALWERSDAPPRYNAGWEAEDAGRQLVAEVELPAVPYGTQVQRLMKAWIEDERRFRRHNLTLPPDAAILEPLDTVSWTSADHGYSGKVFEVGDITDDFDTCLQTVAIREREAGDFAWVPGADEIAVVHPDPTRLEPAPRILPAFNMVRFDLLDTSDNARKPGLRLSWSTTDLLDNDRIEYRLQLPNGTAVTSGVVMDAGAGFVVISGGLIPGTEYRASARVVTDGPANWTPWVHATTGAVLIGKDDISHAAVDWDALGDDVKQNIQATKATRAGDTVSGNAVFSLWSGSAPDGYTIATDGQGTVSRDTSDGLKYDQAALIETIAAPTAPGPRLTMQAEMGGLHHSRPAQQIFEIIVEAELELLSDDWGSARIQARWNARGDGTSGISYIDLWDAADKDKNVIQRIQMVIKRPANYVPSSDADDAVLLDVYGTTAANGGPAPARFRVHSIDYRLLDGSAEAELYQKAVAVEEIQASAIGMRVVSGTESQQVAELELVALSDPKGESKSSARVKADNILLEGSVRARYMQVDEFLDIDAQDAGFRMDKQGVNDFARDGVYMGRHNDGSGAPAFGFMIGRNSGGKEEYLRLTRQEGLVIKNAKYVIGAGVHTSNTYASSTNVSLAGKKTFAATLQGGGGGGRGGTAYNGQGGNWGGNGGNTVVQLFDGGAHRATWTAPGGAGGQAVHGGPRYGIAAPQSPYGNSGNGGNRGSRSYSRWDDRRAEYEAPTLTYGLYGDHGYPGQTRTTGLIDISGYSDPRLVITVGGGGAGGAGGGTNGGSSAPNQDQWSNIAGTAGLNGNGGCAIVQTNADVFSDAGPVAVAPTANGTFMSGAGQNIYVPFPNIQPWRGHWQLVSFGGQITIQPGGGGHWVTMQPNQTTCFFSFGTPVVVHSAANATIFYTFRAM